MKRRERWIFYAPRSGEVHVSKGNNWLARFLVRREAGRYSLILMVDYGAEMPLWGRDAEHVDDLDPVLIGRLEAWQSDFGNNFHYEQGWSSPEVRDRWAAEAVELEADLRAAIPSVKLKVDLWPLEK